MKISKKRKRKGTAQGKDEKKPRRLGANLWMSASAKPEREGTEATRVVGVDRFLMLDQAFTYERMSSFTSSSFSLIVSTDDPLHHAMPKGSQAHVAERLEG
jgi:hypothetical protein